MSWNYTVHQINRSFEQLAVWYREFMQRTEQSLRSLHDRIRALEVRQQWVGPTDEQVERVLRKILAERFTDAGVHQPETPHLHVMDDRDYFVDKPKQDARQMTIPFNLTALTVDPEAVPSKAYRETFRDLENGIKGYPHVEDDTDGQQDDDSDVKDPSPIRHANSTIAQTNTQTW
ncbi:hypothetical protein BS50DRAFT_312060 [Corynespora cassiicola Philippines]|uniref:Uncharacterized protein n=1 Tax=Corynespora cassiicola Philippines TaxID=1448308 RepID=A0A2T2NYB2_CORCC|nr:hypothetical protein BS50DRAFT_312060 [Corynespora cassiicola Philippines]